MRQVLGVDRGAAVVHGEDRALPPAGEPHADDGALGRVLGGVVQQRVRHAGELGAVAGHLDALLGVALDLAAPLERHGVELEGRLLDDLAEGELHEGAHGPHRARLGLVGPRKREQVLHEALHVLGLLGRRVHPAGVLLAEASAPLQDLDVGDNHGERGLELVRGVGDEAPLRVPCLAHRLDGALGEHARGGVERHEAHAQDGEGRSALLHEEHVPRVGVADGDAHTVGRRLRRPGEVVRPVVALGRVGGHGVGDHLLQGIGVDLDGGLGTAEHIAVLRHVHGDGEHAVRPDRPLAVARAHLRVHGAPLLEAALQKRARHVHLRGRVRDEGEREGEQQHRPREPEGDARELAAQPLEHAYLLLHGPRLPLLRASSRLWPQPRRAARSAFLKPRRPRAGSRACAASSPGPWSPRGRASCAGSSRRPRRSSPTPRRPCPTRG